MIHKYKMDDLNFCLDVNSGSIHVLDDVSYAIVDMVPEGVDKVVESFKAQFEESTIRSSFEELKKLMDEGELHSTDSYLDDFTRTGKNPVVKAMCLHVSHDCNIRCKYCFASQGDFKGDRKLMSYEVGQKALEYLAKNSGSRRNLEVDFFGGEPLMNFDVVKKLVDYGRELEKSYDKNFRFTITTNGVLLNEENMAYINENMENVVLSIDGRPEINDRMRYTIGGDGTYDIILPKFKKLVENRTKSYYVRGTFTHFNTDFAKDVIHLADCGFKLTSVEPVVASPENDYALTREDLGTVFEQYETLAREMVSRIGKENDFDFFHFIIDMGQGPCAIKRVSGCGAGTEYLAVTPEGDFYPCHQFVGDEKFRIGSVDDGVTNSTMVSDFNSAHVYSKKECTTCWAKFYCSGGCHANAYNFNGDIRTPYAIGCEMEKKRIECAIYLQASKMLAGTETK